MTVIFRKTGFILLLGLLACDQSYSVREYKDWIEKTENGLLQKKTLGKIELKLQYKPLDYIVINELRQKKIKKTEYDSLKKQFAGMEYFDLHIGRTDGMELFEEENSELKNMYMIDRMQHDFSLVCGSDTLPCLLYHMESTGKIKPYRTLLLGFASDNTPCDSSDLVFIYEDKIFGLGKQVFVIQRKDINNVPILKTY